LPTISVHVTNVASVDNFTNVIVKNAESSIIVPLQVVIGPNIQVDPHNGASLTAQDTHTQNTHAMQTRSKSEIFKPRVFATTLVAEEDTNNNLLHSIVQAVAIPIELRT